ncbi:hypothetical protein SISSUDRAFT_1068096 [Sistotremastrum suecicum HHB10207 ss-3]|uniref:Uncharacterized protein n=1 Tax=Sistotremastrum suecicum HHB10207 ss-3 TaxID=1314776 RepID=A0A165WFT7_9AGAM|nr:hypothetical protein SISSUDRAFT_1068096 [Sistotremastrum suecicum HHB10207 ss-3]
MPRKWSFFAIIASLLCYRLTIIFQTLTSAGVLARPRRIRRTRRHQPLSSSLPSAISNTSIRPPSHHKPNLSSRLPFVRHRQVKSHRPVAGSSPYPSGLANTEVLRRLTTIGPSTSSSAVAIAITVPSLSRPTNHDIEIVRSRTAKVDQHNALRFSSIERWRWFGDMASLGGYMGASLKPFRLVFAANDVLHIFRRHRVLLRPPLSFFEPHPIPPISLSSAPSLPSTMAVFDSSSCLVIRCLSAPTANLHHGLSKTLTWLFRISTDTDGFSLHSCHPPSLLLLSPLAFVSPVLPYHSIIAAALDSAHLHHHHNQPATSRIAAAGLTPQPSAINITTTVLPTSPLAAANLQTHQITRQNAAFNVE